MLVSESDYVYITCEFGEKHLFERTGINEWHHEHWERKSLWGYEEDNLTDDDVQWWLDNYKYAENRIHMRKY